MPSMAKQPSSPIAFPSIATVVHSSPSFQSSVSSTASTISSTASSTILGGIVFVAIGGIIHYYASSYMKDMLKLETIVADCERQEPELVHGSLVALNGLAVVVEASEPAVEGTTRYVLHEVRHCRDIEEAKKKTKTIKVKTTVDTPEVRIISSTVSTSVENSDEEHEWTRKRITDSVEPLKGMPLVVRLYGHRPGPLDGKLISINSVAEVSKLISKFSERRQVVDRASEAGTTRRTLAVVQEQWGLREGANVTVIGQVCIHEEVGSNADSSTSPESHTPLDNGGHVSISIVAPSGVSLPLVVSLDSQRTTVMGMIGTAKIFRFIGQIIAACGSSCVAYGVYKL